MHIQSLLFTCAKIGHMLFISAGKLHAILTSIETVVCVKQNRLLFDLSMYSKTSDATKTIVPDKWNVRILNRKYATLLLALQFVF